MADKEINILLDEITGGPGAAPHVLVTLDACYSGGGTRDGSIVIPDELNVRQVKVDEEAEGRLLDTYYLGAFRDRIEGGDLALPSTPHIVLTACTNTELALEAGGGGLFTQALLDSLYSEPGPGLINYSELLIRTRAAVKQAAFKEDLIQTPQFEVLGGLKANTLFLEGIPYGEPDRYEIDHKLGEYIVKLGAIHGLPSSAEIQKLATSENRSLRLEIFSYNNIEKEVIRDEQQGGNRGNDGTTEQDDKSAFKNEGDRYSTLEFKRSDFGVKLHVIDFDDSDDKNYVEGAWVRKVDDHYSAIEFRREDFGIQMEIFDAEAEVQDRIQLDAQAPQGKKSTDQQQQERKRTKTKITRIEGQKVGEAEIVNVGPFYSTLRLDPPDLTLTGKKYYGVLNYLPADPEFVMVSGSDDDVDTFILAGEAFSRLQSRNVQLIKEEHDIVSHSLEVIIDDDEIKIKDLRANRWVNHTCRKHKPEEVMDDLIRIVNWRRFVALENPDSNSKLKDKISLALDLGKERLLPGDELFIAKKEDRKASPMDPPGERYYQLTPHAILEEGGLGNLHFYSKDEFPGSEKYQLGHPDGRFHQVDDDEEA